MKSENDFGKGSISKNIMKLAIPMTLAQLINILYNIVDRMYIGRIPNASSLALTGVGVTFPIITIIMAFANLFGMGGSPLCSIERGKGNNRQAEKIMGNSFAMLLLAGILLTIIFLLIKKPVLYMFGASDETFRYANDYISIYIIGSIFVMISLGMNSFINAQGFAKTGMITILLGAIVNIILDPIFIFVMHMGVKGAALATIISQFLSACWVLRFLISDKAILKLRKKDFILDIKLIFEIAYLGLSGFIMALTNSSVQIVCNISLQMYGGDLYVGIMTVINSVREVVMMPVQGITNASQPVISFNYGARKYERVKSAIKFMSLSCIIYTTGTWVILKIFPLFFIKLFNKDPLLIDKGIWCMGVYFFGFFMMSLQFAGQSTFVSLGKSTFSIFFSIFRKVIIVVPLTLLLPKLFNLGIIGVFMAEPISNFIGGIACYSTMLFTVWRSLSESENNKTNSNNSSNVDKKTNHVYAN